MRMRKSELIRGTMLAAIKEGWWRTKTSPTNNSNFIIASIKTSFLRHLKTIMNKKTFIFFVTQVRKKKPWGD